MEKFKKLSREQMKRIGGGKTDGPHCGDPCEGFVPWNWNWDCSCVVGGYYIGECVGTDGCTSCDHHGSGSDEPGVCDIIIIE